MKDVEVRKIKKIKENVQKLFTKKKISNTINKNYYPLKVNCKICKKGSDLSIMRNKELEEMKKGTNWKDKMLIDVFPKIFIKIYKKGIEKGFNSRM